MSNVDTKIRILRHKLKVYVAGNDEGQNLFYFTTVKT